MDLDKKRRQQSGIKSLWDRRESGEVQDVVDESLFVHGPENFDCLSVKWSRTQVLGIIADSGVGKSETALTFIPDILVNNPKSSVVYVSLEMTNQDIAERMFKITANDMELSKRLYILSRYDENGISKDVSMEWIKREVQKIRDVVGDIVTVVVDHIHVLGENDPSTLNSIMVALKEMAVGMNCLVIPLAQVNKSSSGKGELPLDADAVLGCSQFKYICSDIIQLHRPIFRLEEEAGLNVLSWGYCKIRKTKPEDKVKRGQNKLLTYDQTSCTFKELGLDEYKIFSEYYNMLLELKSAEEKKKAFAYDIQRRVVRPDGSEHILKVKFSGDGYNDI